MRLIDADALKERVNRTIDYAIDEFDKGYNIGIQKAVAIIDNAPTVNPEKPIFSEVWYQERPQGEWIMHITYFECSNCKHCYDYDYAEDIDPITDLIFNFCPDCGASMKKGGAE